MKLYILTKYNRMENEYEKSLYVSKQKAETEVKRINDDWTNGKGYLYESAYVKEIETVD